MFIASVEPWSNKLVELGYKTWWGGQIHTLIFYVRAKRRIYCLVFTCNQKNDALFKGLGTFCMTQNTNVHRITLNLLTVHEYYDGSKRP